MKNSGSFMFCKPKVFLNGAYFYNTQPQYIFVNILLQLLCGGPNLRALSGVIKAQQNIVTSAGIK